jgi:hypothetical protein
MLCEELNYPWTADEIARTIHSRVGAADAVRRIEAAGRGASPSQLASTNAGRNRPPT